ncbi:MAG: arylsulfatase [Acidobacteriota bacterium]
MKCWTWLLTGLLALASCSSGEAVEQQQKPNIIFIMADDLGYGHLGAYGQEKIRTPNLDWLAAQGMKFLNAYAGESVCAPSRSVLMTGLHMGHTPIRANGQGMYLNDEDLTLAEVLQQAGYSTGAFGKWGLGDEGDPGHPNRQGFDEFFGQLDQVHAHFYYPYWVWHNQEKYALPQNEGEQRSQYVQDEIHAKALDFIRRNKERPFFAYLPYILPHVELVVPEDSEHPYRDQFPKVSILDSREGYIGSDHGYATYAGMISRLDRQVGEVMALLKELNLEEDTLVIFTSDNGAQGGQRWGQLVEFFDGTGGLRGSKGEVYEGGIRVPLIAHWPGRIEAGSVTDHVCYFADVMPTLAEVAGAKPPQEIDGISFLPTLLGQEGQQTHPYLYWAHYQSYAERPSSQAVRMGNWKGVQPAPDAPLEVYDLESDVAETRDVSQDNPEVTEQIGAAMQQAFTERRRFEPEPNPTRSDFVR